MKENEISKFVLEQQEQHKEIMKVVTEIAEKMDQQASQVQKNSRSLVWYNLIIIWTIAGVSLLSTLQIEKTIEREFAPLVEPLNQMVQDIKDWEDTKENTPSSPTDKD